MNKKLFSFILLISLISIFAVGCGDSSKDSDTKKDDSASTVTITDAKGEVTIPANPKKIVDLSGNSDILHILGYEVIGTANSDAYDYTKLPSYLQDSLKNAKILGFSYQDTMDIEGILELEPDLIIISNIQEKMYTSLKEIAPTVMIELAQIDWKDDINTIAKIFGKEEQANEWLKNYSEKAAAIGEKIKEQNGDDATYLSFLASGGQLYIFDAAGVGSVFYEDLKLAKPSNMPNQENVSLPVVDYEGLAAIDSDFIIVLGTDEDLKALNDSSIYKNIRAVKDGNVVTLPASPYFNMGYSSIGRNLFLDEVLGLMENLND